MIGFFGYGFKLYDNSVFENLMKSLEFISKFCEEQFNFVKNGFKVEGEVILINGVYFKVGILILIVSIFFFKYWLYNWIQCCVFEFV